MIDNSLIITDPEDMDSQSLKQFLSLFTNNNKLKDEINILMKYYNIVNIKLEEIEDKITVLLNKDIYLKEINNIVFFLEKIKVKETAFLEKLKEIIYNITSLNNENNTNNKKQYEIIKGYLNYLKENNIYDYKSSNIHLNIYKYLYDNELAIAFLLDKDPESIQHLGEKLDPMETTLTNEDINFFENC